ncbi:MAG: aldehyde reductase [Anaeromyxobacter sp.]
MSTVLVTGGSGFIGSHTILRLLADGHRVRATVRSARREAELRALLRAAGVDPADRLSFALADLNTDVGWAEAAAGCERVLHLASPFPPTLPKDADELVVPAREGALRVLRAARDAGVRRVVLTSSFAAVGYGHAPRTAPFDETTWTDVDGPGVQPYPRSKTLAERAAWDFITREGRGLELATVNPVVVLGPVLGTEYSTSILIVKRLLDGAVPGCPKVSFGVVDVRDVADLHVRAMTHPSASGERFLAVAGDFLTMLGIARVLKGRMGAAARRVPSLQVPDWILRLASLRDAAARQVLPELGNPKNATSAKAQRLLGWCPRPAEEAIVATGESLVRLGLVRGAER